jgi:hypothetical protein
MGRQGQVVKKRAVRTVTGTIAMRTIATENISTADKEDGYLSHRSFEIRTS